MSLQSHQTVFSRNTNSTTKGPKEMSPPDDTVMTFIRDWLWAPFLGLITFAWTHHTKRVDDLRLEQDKKVQDLRQHVDAQDKDIMDEVNRFRDVTKQLFDKLDEHARRSEDRHIEILNALHTGLAQKADKK